MKTFKLTIALSFLILAVTSCSKDHDYFTRSTDNINLTGAQVVPANTSTGTAKLQGSYNSKSKLFSYTLTYTGLSANITSVRIYGPADPGFALPAPIQSNSISTPTGGINTSGTYTNTLYMDGFAAREDDLLNGKYYIQVHTVGPFATAGELRSQITFK